MTLSKHKVDSETELNSKIEQNKMLINKVQKVLNIIKLGVQFPTASQQDFKLENTTSDIILPEAKSEVETAVHMYEEFNEDDLPLQESKSDINMDVGAISIEELQEEALRARAEKSDVETAVRHIGETTSEDTFKPPSMTDEDVIDEEELAKIDEIIKQNGLDNLKDINQERPLTRRNEDVKWTEDKFRTEPVMTDRYSVEMSDFDIVQAKLDTIHDTESESASDDMYIESVTKEIPATGELSDDHINSISNTDTYNISEPVTKSNVTHKQSEIDYVQENNKTDIRNDFPFKSRIIDQNLRYKSDCKQPLGKNKHMSKIPPLPDDSKRSKNSAKGLVINETDFSTSMQLDVKTNYPSNSESIELYQKSNRNKDVGSNTAHSAECKDIACSTDDSGRGTDFTCNTGIVQCKDIASNTEQPAKLKNTAAATDNSEKRNVASNTECKRNDFGSNTKPQQKDFACKVELRKGCRDAICDTDYLKIKTSNAVCYTDIRTIPAATQKCRMDGINMSYESVENINIPSNKHLKKSEVLQVQLLPPINIVSLPTVQRIFQFYIDKHGKSHVAYQPSMKTIAYLEVRSPSYNKQSEVKVKTTNTLIDHRNYEHGFREIKKMEPPPLLRSPRRKCKFFIDHKYNLDYESGSETDKMIKASVNKTRYPNLCKIGVCSGDDGEFFIEAKSAQETQMGEDGTWTYLTKYGTYLKRTCSDSSLVVKTIKGASAHALASDSETNSRIESVSESNKICSSKNIHSSENSSQWVGEFVSQNIDEKVYKTYINPDGFSRRHSRWKYATEKTQTNLECFANRSSRDYKELKKSCKTIETQTQPWRPEPISKPTSTFTELTSSIVSDQTIKDNPKSFSTSDQSQNQQKSHSIRLKNTNSITNRTPIQRSLETPTKTLQQKAVRKPTEGAYIHNFIEKIVKNPDASVESFAPNFIRFSDEIKVRNQGEKLNHFETSEAGSRNVESPDASVESFAPNFIRFSDEIKVRNQGEKLNHFETSEAGSRNVESPDFSMKTNNENIQSWDKISLTVTCSTDESSIKDSSNNPFVIEAFSKREANSKAKKSKHSENPVKNVKQKNAKEEALHIPRKDIKFATESKSKRRNNEKFGIVEKSKKLLQKTVENNLEIGTLLERKTKTDSKNQQPSREIGFINERTNYIPIEQHMLQGDSLLVDKQRKLQGLRNQHKEKSNLLVDDIINKFRNIYMIDTDATHDTTEISLSEGEIKCYCSTSTGEIHDCIKINQKFQKPRSFQKDIGIAPIKKRRNYFNNWTTYYFNKYSFANNSSSTS